MWSLLLSLSLLQAATKKQKYEKISEKKMSTPVEVLCKVNQYHHCRHCYHHHCSRHHHHVHSCRSALQGKLIAFFSRLLQFRPWSLVTGQSILFPQDEIFKCVSGQFFKSFLVANSLCGPGSASHTFPSFPPSGVTKTRGNSLSGTEQWSSVLRARHLRKFACGPAVSRSATNFRNIRAPQHRAICVLENHE